MKWKHHSIFAASMASLLGMNVVDVVYCACLANLPDQMETIGRVRIVRHRTLTHDLGLWGGACVLLYLLATSNTIPDRFFVSTWAIPLPGVMHLLGDVLTPCGIHFFGTKIRFPLFKTGSLVEWAFVLLIALTALMGAPNLRHFRHEFFPF
jgi:membrane-bound metal-dependent hydrolase YbcI (DUF457 family)